jgi:hypothetical protein
MSFQSLPRVEPKEDDCGERYYEYDGREGRVPAICTLKKGHPGDHGQRPWSERR